MKFEPVQEEFFSQTVKKEISQRELNTHCCQTAACYGAACFAKYFDAKGLVLHTEQEYIAKWAKKAFALCGVTGEVTPRGADIASSYEFAIKDPFEIEKMLALFGHAGDEIALRVLPDNFGCQNCFSAFSAAAFLCCGTITNPQKGYSLEFVAPRYKVLQDFAQILTAHNFSPKFSVRKGVHVLYFKASEQIEDLLTYMGAPKASLEIMSMKVYKDFRNKANRITNCETANIDKMVAANRQVLIDIQTLDEDGLLATLPEPLLAAARLRREYPDVSLAELAQHSKEPVSKSGLSHRYKKIGILAEKCRSAKSKMN